MAFHSAVHRRVFLGSLVESPLRKRGTCTRYQQAARAHSGTVDFDASSPAHVAVMPPALKTHTPNKTRFSIIRHSQALIASAGEMPHRALHPSADLEPAAGAGLGVDGGGKTATAPGGVEAGASVLVSGTGIFNHPDGVIAGIAALREAIDPSGA